jgi:hypothetical protein
MAGRCLTTYSRALEKCASVFLSFPFLSLWSSRRCFLWPFPLSSPNSQSLGSVEAGCSWPRLVQIHSATGMSSASTVQCS